MCVVVYFLFVICLCVFALVVTIIVLHLYLRAENTPMVRMPAWVSYLFHFQVLKDTEQISIASVLTFVMHIDFRVAFCASKMFIHFSLHSSQTVSIHAPLIVFSPSDPEIYHIAQ